MRATRETVPPARRRKRTARRNGGASAAPIVAGVEPVTATATARGAARLARQLGAPLTFVYVRPSAPAALGHPNYERQLRRELYRGRRALDQAIAAASSAGVAAHGEIIAGDPARRLLEFAGSRRARLLVVGPRRRRFGRSVSRRLLRAAELPVVVSARIPEDSGDDASGGGQPAVDRDDRAA